MQLKTFFLFILLSSIHLNAVENSIIPTIDKFEQIDNIPKAKFSKRQYAEIKSSLEKIDEKIRLVTYNILFSHYDQNLDEINRWPQRLPRIVALMKEMKPDIIGVQELYEPELNEILPFVEKTYAFYAKPCEDGELNGIFYRKDRFECIDSKVWYMSRTPEVPTADTLTMVKLKDLDTGKSFAVFNTHLAFSLLEVRNFQARFIAKQIEPYAREMPTIFAGDMNTFPNRMELNHLPFWDGDYVHQVITKGSLKDAKDVAVLGHLGPISTTTYNYVGKKASPFVDTGVPGVMLDRIYVSKGINVLVHAVQPGTVEGHFPSDHLPVLIDFIVD